VTKVVGVFVRFRALHLRANAAGDIRYVDVNGDGVLDANDRTNLESNTKATMGFNLH
jgi:hypothetical protein